jgi:hypothetical protein
MQKINACNDTEKCICFDTQKELVLYLSRTVFTRNTSNSAQFNTMQFIDI